MARRSRSGWAWAAGAATVLTAGWVLAAVFMLDRGFDTTDEGFYLLSYRWWDSTTRVFTGNQYLYGPVFELLGWSVPGLRVVRIISLVLVHATFGWAFMSWLRTRRPTASPSKGWEVAGTLVVTAVAGITYGWLPASPGYNDPVLLGSLLLASVVLWSLRVVVGGAPLPVSAAACVGPPVVAMILAKWVAVLATLPFLAVVGVLALHAAGARGWLRYLAAVVLSTTLSALLVQVLLTPLPALTRQVVSLSLSVSEDDGSLAKLLRYYTETTLSMLRDALTATIASLLVAAVIAVVLRVVGLRALVPAILLAPLAGMYVYIGPRQMLPGGGGAATPRYVALLVSLSIVVLVAVTVDGLLHHRSNQPHSDAEVSSPRPSGRTPDVYVVAMLLLLPAVQALGTNNPFFYLSINQFGCWAALLVAACTATRLTLTGRWLVVSATACAVVIAVTSGVDGMLRHPYRTVGFEQATTRVGGPGSIGDLRVDATTASRFREVEAAVGDLPTGTPVVAFDHMPGVVLLLGGRSVGEAWYDSVNFERTAAGIRAECRNGWPHDRPPVVIYSRAPTPVDTAALAACGFSLESGFRRVEVTAGDPDLTVYVPTARPAPR